MKLAFAITVFDGLELLEKSVWHHRPAVDELIICYQTISNTGTKDFVIEKYLEEKYPLATLVRYDTDLRVDPKENERRKHQLMIDTGKRLKCTHIILAAVDHFYELKDITEARVTASEYDVSFTKMFTYYKHPTWQLTPIETYFMPFIIRLYPQTRIMKGTQYPLLVDPSVRVNTHSDWFLLDYILHHYSMVRVDMEGKLRNSASNFSKARIEKYLEEWNNYSIDSNPGVQYFQGRKIKVVPNYFNL